MRKRMVGLIAVGMLVSGCGSSDEYANDPRPPKRVTIAVTVKNDRLLVSPGTVGAGPARLLISNQSDASHDVALTAADGPERPCIDAAASSGAINPGGSAQVAVELEEGACQIAVRGRAGPDPTALAVGPTRTSAQSELLQP